MINDLTWKKKDDGKREGEGKTQRDSETSGQTRRKRGLQRSLYKMAKKQKLGTTVFATVLYTK